MRYLFLAKKMFFDLKQLFLSYKNNLSWRMKPLVIDLLPLMSFFFFVFNIFQFLLKSIFDCYHDTIRALNTYRGFSSETCCRSLIQIITFEKKELDLSKVLLLTSSPSVIKICNKTFVKTQRNTFLENRSNKVASLQPPVSNKEISEQVFSYKFCETFQNAFFA